MKRISKPSQFLPRLSAMHWAMLAMVLLAILATVVVGVALFDVTGRPGQFSSQ